MKKFLLFAVFVFFVVKVFSCKKDPKIIFSTQMSNLTVNGNKALIKGRIEPEDVSLVVNSDLIVPVEDGSFEVELPLPDTSNHFTFSLKSEGNIGASLFEDSYFIRRELTSEESLNRKRQEQILLSNSRADERKWNQSKAGRIQKKHPDWSREDCESIAKRRIWVGMSYGMLKYMRGLPNHANPSNYGGDTQWQWCWDDYTPSCFYDRDGDGNIDAYN
jgi:hypothetical protein